MFSNALNINIDDESNTCEDFYDSISHLPQIESNCNESYNNIESNNTSNNSFFSCDQTIDHLFNKTNEHFIEIKVDKQSVFQSNDLMVGQLLNQSKDEEDSNEWLECCEDNNNIDISFNKLEFNDSTNDEKRFQQFMQLLDKSKQFSQVLENNLSKQKEKRLSQINDINTQTIDSEESDRKEKDYNRSYDSRQILTQMNTSNGSGDQNSPQKGVRRSQRKRKSSVLCNDEIYQLLNSSDESRDCHQFNKDIAFRERFFNGSQIDLRQPYLISGALMRNYQLEGLDWLKLLQENNMNGILADEMGLGKTIQCIALIAHLIESDKCGTVLGPYLVVAPLTTLHNWKTEFERFAPLIPTLLFHGHKKERSNLRKLINNVTNIHTFGKSKRCFPVVITSYEMFKFEIGTMKKYDWNYVVIDEGHKIKNIKCQLSKMMRQIRSKNRLILTGTPLHNCLAELWSLLNFVSPNIFNDLQIFEEWIASNSSDEQIIQQEKEKKIISTLHQILSPFMLRRTKGEVGLDLPPKKEVLIYAPSTLTQQALYETAINLLKDGKTKSDYFTVKLDLSEGRKRRKCVKDIDYSQFDKDFDQLFDEDSNTSLIVNEKVIQLPPELITDENSPQFVSFGRFTKNNIMMQMRKITNHPFLVQWPINPKTGDVIVDKDIIRSSGKMRALDELLKQLYIRKHRVLLFSQMTKMLDIIEEYCHYRRYSYRRLDGSTNLDIRRHYINEFNRNDDIFLFLISTRAGGLGINLVGADTAIIYDSDWNPQMDLQAQDRCHRIGQSKPVIVYRLVTANTIDEKMIRAANSKRKLDKMIIQKGHFFRASDQFIRNESQEFSLQELLNVLQSTDFNAIYNYSSDKLENDRLYSDEDLKKMLDRTNFQESEDSFIEIGAQSND